MRLLLVLSCLMVVMGLNIALADDSASPADAPYWRGEKEVTPGPMRTATPPAATDLWVSCDRWPDSSDLRRFAEDAVRLSGAKTDHEKALAVWRWIRRFKVHTDGNPPIDYICAKGRNDDVMQVLNVYGAHYCGGLAIVANHVWRALGMRSATCHCASHAMVDLFYADGDGVTRPHLFDVNFGGYLYSHSRQRIASCDDWTADYNGGKDNWEHAEARPWSTHRMELTLRPHEWLTRLWGNEGKPFQSHMDPERDTRRTPLFERGPYTDRTYGNGLWTLPLKESGQLAAEPENMTISNGRFMPKQAGQPASVVWQVRTPYIISDMQLRMTMSRKTAKDAIRVLVSTDGGETFNEKQPLWTCPDELLGDPASFEAAKEGKPGGKAPATKRGETYMLVGREVFAELCRKYEVKEGSPPPKDLVSPFGRYSCLLKLELTASAEPGDCFVQDIQCLTWVQQNLYALPQLQPGRNRITVRGTIAPEQAVRVTYVWDDAKGKSRRNETLIEKAPFTYEILAAGSKWEDVTCRLLCVEAMSAGGKGNVTLVKEEPCEVVELPAMPHVDSTRGRSGWWQRDDASKLPAVDKLIADLGDAARKESAIKALQELRDPKAFDAVAKFALAEPNPTLKGPALVTLFQTDRARSKPILLGILDHPEKVAWTDQAITKGPGNGNQQWADTAIVIGEMAVQDGWSEAVPGLVKVWNSGHMFKHVPFAIMRVLSKIGDERAADAVRDGLTRGGYTAAYAALAAARLGLRDQIPQVRKVAASYYRVWQQYAIISLGRLGDMESAPLMREQLKSWDEEQRAAAAIALGELRDAGSLAALNAAVAAEPFPWVRQKIADAIKRLAR